MVDESADPELTFSPRRSNDNERQTRKTNVENNKDGHRAYTAERKTKLLRLTADLRNSDSLLTEFVAKPDQMAAKYDLQLTEEEISAVAAIAGGEELSEDALAAVAGGGDVNINCPCGGSF
jgi:hypothetical protein